MFSLEILPLKGAESFCMTRVEAEHLQNVKSVSLRLLVLRFQSDNLNFSAKSRAGEFLR